MTASPIRPLFRHTNLHPPIHLTVLDKLMIHLLEASTLLCISIYSHIGSANPPDTIFYNGKILTVDPLFSVAEAIAISDGRIVAVGSNAEILEVTGSQTNQFDLEGHTVIPGLIDNRMHYMRGASRWRFEARIDGVTSRKKALNIISQRAKEIELLSPGYSSPRMWNELATVC